MLTSLRTLFVLSFKELGAANSKLTHTYHSSFINSLSNDPRALKHVPPRSLRVAALPRRTDVELVVAVVSAELAFCFRQVGGNVAKVGGEETSYYVGLRKKEYLDIFWVLVGIF